MSFVSELESTPLLKAENSLVPRDRKQIEQDSTTEERESQKSHMHNYIHNLGKRSTPYQFPKNLGNQFVDIEKPFSKFSSVPVNTRIERAKENTFLSRQSRQRPPFAGQTGGNFRPQIIPSGTPWPSKPEQNTNEPQTNRPQIVDRFEETTKRRPSPGFIWNGNSVTSSTFPPLIRPPINVILEEDNRPSQTSRPPKPPQTTSYPDIIDRFKETAEFPFTEIITKPTRPRPNRPFFAGQTGGNYHPQLIPPGKPWPARPEDYATFGDVSSIPQKFTKTTAAMEPDKSELHSTLSIEPEKTDVIKETTSKRPPAASFEDRFEKVPSNSPTKPPPNRPPFAGETGGNFRPQIVPPGKPLPSKPLDDTLTETTAKPLEDKFEEVPSKAPTRPSENRPPFAGQTGGNFSPQIVPPGNLLPSKPQESTSKRPTTIPFEDRFEEVPSKPPTRPPPNRPFFAGETGGNSRPQLIPSGTPWPSKPNKSPSKETTTNPVNEISSNAPTRPPSKEPSSGENYKPQTIPCRKRRPGAPFETDSKIQASKNKISTHQTTPLSLIHTAQKAETTTVEGATSHALFTSKPIPMKKT